MKLRQISAKSTVEEQLAYLRKRHCLYFCSGKINEAQVAKMLSKLINSLSKRAEMNEIDEIGNFERQIANKIQEEDDDIMPMTRENLEKLAANKVSKMYDGVFDVEGDESSLNLNEDDYFDDFN